MYILVETDNAMHIINAHVWDSTFIKGLKVRRALAFDVYRGSAYECKREISDLPNDWRQAIQECLFCYDQPGAGNYLVNAENNLPPVKKNGYRWL